jgi:hypothetical protein
MAGRRQRRDLECSGGDLGAVAEGRALLGKGQVFPLGQDIGGAEQAGQAEAPAYIVIVYVGLQDVGDAHAERLGRQHIAVRVALGVDDDGHLAVMDEIAPVTEPGGVEADRL